ncbi:MAG: amino-acid N-acetyltransferase [Ectothiorhodospiraceae bacterium]|nr:amino-acid N-acetyltransferase [Ectothiorhodospiraceae bacterium]
MSKRNVSKTAKKTTPPKSVASSKKALQGRVSSDARGQQAQWVPWFRNAAPYINAFRGRTFVVVFSGEAVANTHFAGLIHDFALLNSLGIRLVLVHGTRPQVEARLKARASILAREYTTLFHRGLRVTDDTALACVKEAVGTVRVEIEALLSMGLANSPMAGARIRVASGNVVTARPLGVHEGVDYLHTGEVRRIDAEAIKQQLDQNAVVLLSPLGYSPTGEVFNLSAEDVATSAAIALHADKVLYLAEGSGLLDGRKRLTRELTLVAAQKLLTSRRKLPDDMHRILNSAVNLCLNGIKRVHIINRETDGALLQELFTRDGIGTLISADNYEETRQACIDDVAGILELIEPLEKTDVLVWRSRENLEMEIERFIVVERDGMIIACAALYPFAKDNMAELACLAVHPDYQGAARGNALLHWVEQHAQQRHIKQIFVLSTKSSHWFIERGYQRTDIKTLPVKRRALYNYRRNSKVFIKDIS